MVAAVIVQPNKVFNWNIYSLSYLPETWIWIVDHARSVEDEDQMQHHREQHLVELGQVLEEGNPH